MTTTAASSNASAYRSIAGTIHAPIATMGSIRMRQPLPSGSVEQLSPFLLLHHFDLEMEPGGNVFDVPAHPHRGFMPITFMYNGEILHEDSLGNRQTIGAGEVQWINAARGLIHSEKAGRKMVEEGGRFQGVQLWVNLPAAQKMLPPSYQAITANDIVRLDAPGTEVRLISGELNGLRGPAPSDTISAMLSMEKDSRFDASLPEDFHPLLYVLEGVVRVNETQDVLQHDLVHFAESAGDISIKASSDARLLLLAGRPIDEPLAQQGPFVMNTQTELLEAMRDYGSGRMGYLY